ncbi:hypothetical protein ALPO108162_11810 [Alicyclobacillus pomorum]
MKGDIIMQKGTVMLESGLVGVAVVQVDGAEARVRNDEGEEYWVSLSDLEIASPMSPPPVEGGTLPRSGGLI